MDAVADSTHGVLPPNAKVTYDGPAWIGVARAARLVGVSPRTVYLWIRGGRLNAAYLPSGILRVEAASLLSTNEVERVARNVKRKTRLQASQRRKAGVFVGRDAVAARDAGADSSAVAAPTMVVPDVPTGAELHRVYEDSIAPGQPVRMARPRVPLGRRPTT
jgi:hypothetical protein